MLKEKIKYIVKYNKHIFALYKWILSLCVCALKPFYPVRENTILFVVYGGQRYDDSPKEVYEYMKKDTRFKHYKLYWAFQNPDKIEEELENKVQIDTFEYYKTALQCKYWITNSSASRGLNFMPSKTINVVFQHGVMGIKKLGLDLDAHNKSFAIGRERMDYVVITGGQEEPLLNHAWAIDETETKMLTIGLPRNDELIHVTPERVKALRDQLKIPSDKKVILYAPTFREYKRDSLNAVYLKPPFDFDKWQRELGDEYILLLTAHYEVAKLMNVPENHPFIINAFKYPHINDLMIVSDLLITDYSSIVFDYSILGKPVISYAYDYQQYVEERGLYDGYQSIFKGPICYQEDEVISYIKQMDYSEECAHTTAYIRDKFVPNYGNATERFVQALWGDVTE